MLRLLLVAVLLTGMARLTFVLVAEKVENDVNFADIRSREVRIESRWHNLEQFQDIMRQTITELSEEDITLAQAAERIERFAQGNMPIYLRILASRRPMTIRERVARNIVAHFATQIEEEDDNDGQLNRVLCRLKVELATMCRP